MHRLTGILGLAVFLAIAYALSANRQAIRWRTVAWGLGLQVLFALIVLKLSVGQRVLATAGAAITKLLDYSYAGSSLVFGALGVKSSSFGSIFAFQVLPTIIFISAFFAVLYHIGVM